MSGAESSSSRVIASTNVRAYFQESVTEAMANQRIDAAEETVGYVVELLTAFTRTEQFFGPSPEGPALRPLANFYADAVEAPTVEHRHRALKRLGDVALFISGIFSDSLNRRLVDVDYYVAMGGNAYGCLSESVQSSHRGRVFSSIYGELASKFQHFVDVLGEISDRSRSGTESDVLRLYELWLRTGSQRAANQLKTLGIHPVEGCVSRASH
jgi:hypothetical protein